MLKKIELKRIISSGNFIPEVDGLRFVAIISVLLYHLHRFLKDKNTNTYSELGEFMQVPGFIGNGELGVQLFFIISGFILGLFFARAYKSNKKVSHKSYFIRRLTRLEPPYILCMTFLFFVVVFITNKMELIEAFKSLMASIFYVHNFIYPDHLPRLNGVAWSLEIEVQFYILAPFIALIFKVKSAFVRRAVIISVALFFTFMADFFMLPFLSIYDYIEYFLVGFLITDIYLDQLKMRESQGQVAKNNSIILSLISIGLILFFFQLNNAQTPLMNAIYTSLHLIVLGSLFYGVLLFNALPLLRNSWITNIGGACYSIYLLHYPIMSFFGNQLVKFKITNIRLIDNIIYATILIIIILIISGVFYVFIERPCMRKDWYKSFQRKIS